MKLAHDAALAARLVREAGELAHRMRAEGLEPDTKTSISDVVTAADHAAERQVVETLAAERPDDGVLGEEGASRTGTSGRTWIIDPVDGTYNFVAGMDWWCSALALTDGDELVLGAVHHAATGRTFVGGPGLPTTVDGVPLPPLVDRPLAASCVTTYLHPPKYDGEAGAAFRRLVGGAATLRMLGSASLDATAIAAGQLHVRCQDSLPPWDDLPGAALILGVGGATTQVEAGGVTWYAAGVPTAVADIEKALLG
ncbi:MULTISPECIES: inositol monophosphatase family protein [unclassified Nocardioides]|uniref:inositol monophosphatase family protein n=1 Tax=unclassified Nocardioides TaxID=2615069 RepID=UPI00361C77C6